MSIISDAQGYELSGSGSLKYYCYNTQTAADIFTVQQKIAEENGFPVASQIAANQTVFTVSNTNPTYVGGSWTASVDPVSGITYFTGTGVTNYSGAVTVTCPVNIISPTDVTIEAGATVSNSVIVGPSQYPPITLINAGTLERSFVANVVTTVYAGGVSQGNTYISSTYRDGGTATPTAISNFDYFLAPSNSSSVSLDIALPTGTASSIKLSSESMVNSIGAGGKFNSYVGVGSSGAAIVTLNQGAEVGCFLAGTMIKTVNGSIAVEDLKIGDQIFTYHDQQNICSVTWVGYRDFNVRTDLSSEDAAGYPVKIVKDAIAEGVPCKDLLVTPEHSILLQGQFIPVRMLVNGSSIFYDRSITSYTFYHIETEEHSVISANNVLTESYLDTGNRHYFSFDNNVTSIANKKKEWNKDSAAPLVTTRDIVEPIFIQLKERAVVLGYQLTPEDILTTEDSDLHLLTDTGEILYPISQNKEKYIFKISKQVVRVRLISRVSCQSQSIGPFVDDRRYLGVLVGKVTLFEKSKSFSITEHYQAVQLQGWDVQEKALCRWTNGDAYLTIKETKNDVNAMLVIQILAGGPYLVEEAVEHRDIA